MCKRVEAYQMDICFVILHYVDVDTTKECIESILHTFGDVKYKIIIVDNGSPNKSGQTLKKYYHLYSDIEIIINDSNLGFARGNNIGYAYARKKYNPRYIIIGNNDLKFVQTNFYEVLKKYDEEKRFDIAGPDIINLNGIHQNPYRENYPTLKEWMKKYRNQKIMYILCLARKSFPFIHNINFFSKIYRSIGIKNQKKIRYDIEQNNIVLHGSCLIFSNKYIFEQEEAFSDKTFMYHEEEFLYLKCMKYGYNLMYLPRLYVEHKEGESTKKITKSELDKEIFTFRENSRSLKLLINEMKDTK